MAVFTDAQIEEIMKIMMQNFGVHQYIGARYVPIFGRKGEESWQWDNDAPYEPLTVVQYQGNSYTSRQYVPAGLGTPDQHNDFWAETGNWNAQIEAYRNEVLAFDGRINNITSNVGELEIAITELTSDIEKAAIVFDDLESAKNVVDDSYKYIRTLSYHPGLNAGGAFYKVVDVIPTGYYETTANGVYLEIISPDNVAQFGAVGNGGNDDTVAIQNAIDHMDVINFDGDKTYLVANLLISENNKTLNGNGCTIKNSAYRTDALAQALNIGDSSIVVNNPDYFHVNETAYIYNANSNPSFYQIVITGIAGNVLSFKSYKPFKQASTTGDTSPYYFPAGTTIYTGTTIFTVMRGMNVASSGIVSNVTINGFNIEQTTSFNNIDTWGQLGYGVIFYYTENCRFVNNHVKSTTALFLMFYSYNKNVYVVDNIFENSRAYAVCAHWDMQNISTTNRTHNFNVLNNAFYDCQYSIIYSSVDGGNCKNNYINNATVNNRLGIYIYGGDISVYTEYSSYNQEDFYSYNINVSGNTINNAISSGAGIGMSGTKNCTIDNNVIVLASNAFTCVASINTVISNNVVDHNYTYTSQNDSAVRMYGKVINLKINNNTFNCTRIVKIDSLNRTIRTGVQDPSLYWGYNDSKVYIEDNIVNQSARAALIVITGTTETSKAPTQLMDIPLLIMFNKNTIIQANKYDVNIFNFNSTLQEFITTYTNLITQMYAYNNISYGLTMSYTEMNPHVANSGNVTMDK